MSNPSVTYFFKRFYKNIIKWWYVTYIPVSKKIWPTKAEYEAAVAQAKAEGQFNSRETFDYDFPADASVYDLNIQAPDDAYNAATGSFSGLYGQKPVDSATQFALDEILGKSSSQNSVDALLKDNAPAKTEEVVLTEEDQNLIDEANAIFERLLREAAEDEAKKQAEIDAAYASQE